MITQTDQGYIYCFCNGRSQYKIGMTRCSTEQRLNQLNRETSNTDTITEQFSKKVYNPYTCEQTLHKLFDDCRIKVSYGTKTKQTEWFNIDINKIKLAFELVAEIPEDNDELPNISQLNIDDDNDSDYTPSSNIKIDNSVVGMSVKFFAIING